VATVPWVWGDPPGVGYIYHGIYVAVRHGKCQNKGYGREKRAGQIFGIWTFLEN